MLMPSALARRSTSALTECGQRSGWVLGSFMSRFSLSFRRASTRPRPTSIAAIPAYIATDSEDRIIFDLAVSKLRQPRRRFIEGHAHDTGKSGLLTPAGHRTV